MAMGLVTCTRMDVKLHPDIKLPAASFTISQPGAAPPELEIQITRRVEAAVRGLNGVSEIQSTIREGSSNNFVMFEIGTPIDRARTEAPEPKAPTREGSTTTFVMFEIGTPIDRAVTEVRDAVARIRGDLPD